MTRLFDLDRHRTCAWARARLDALALDTLAPGDRQRLERHLARCASCEARAREESELLALLPRALEPRPPRSEVLVRVLDRVRAGRHATRRWGVGVGIAAAASLLFLTTLLVRPLEASSLARALESPNVVVINLFVALDAPLSARYEYRTVSRMRFDDSVGRMLFDISSGQWRLVVHGLPRPPRGARYVLGGQLDGEGVDLGQIERWEDGVAVLDGRTDLDLTQLERISLQLVSPHSRLRLLDAIDGAG